MSLRILADQNIPLVQETFGALGEVRAMSGRAIGPDDVRHADVLLVRSVTRVDGQLLDGSPVRYVATATIGTDHLDIEYLESRGIQWCSAPGSNADSVTDYVMCCLLYIADLSGRNLDEMKLGIVGCGNVGGRVSRRARSLGMQVVENDPPLARSTGAERYRPLKEIYDCDVVTLHTPLTMTGPDATHHLVEHRFLNRMKSGACLINTSRGAVVDNAILKATMRDRNIKAILDVWEHEPAIDRELLDMCVIGTPHIAGYSIDGKVRGTWQIYQTVCGWINKAPALTEADLIGILCAPYTIDIHLHDVSDLETLKYAVTQVYDVLKDDAALRQAAQVKQTESFAQAFDLLRKNYWRRRELASTVVRLQHGTESQKAALQAVGFQVIGT